MIDSYSWTIVITFSKISFCFHRFWIEHNSPIFTDQKWYIKLINRRDWNRIAHQPYKYIEIAPEAMVKELPS